MSTIIIKAKKVMNNPLLSRRQMCLDIIHPEKANVSQKELKEILSKRLKVDEGNIVIYGLRTDFGGQRSSGFALVYENTEYLLKYEPKARLRRMKVLQPKTSIRKAKKELKGKIKRSRSGEKCKILKQKKGENRNDVKRLKEEYLKKIGGRN